LGAVVAMRKIRCDDLRIATFEPTEAIKATYVEELTAELVTDIESFAPSKAVTPLIRSSFADTMRELRRLLEIF